MNHSPYLLGNPLEMLRWHLEQALKSAREAQSTIPGASTVEEERDAYETLETLMEFIELDIFGQPDIPGYLVQAENAYRELENWRSAQEYAEGSPVSESLERLWRAP